MYLVHSQRKRPTLDELRHSPPFVWKLELVQLALEASGTDLEEQAFHLLEGPEDAITPESVDALRQQLGTALAAIPA